MTIRSQWKLPHPEASLKCSTVIDLTEASPALFEGLQQRATPAMDNWYLYRRLDDGKDYLCVPGLFEMLVSADGKKVFGRLLREYSDHIFIHLFHAAASFGLTRLGVEHLHATAIATRTKAFGFLGRSGYGKSSLAAAFLQSGYSILTDDMLAMKSKGEVVSALPGPSHLKLFNDAAGLVIRERIAGLSFNPLSQKLVIPLSGQSPESGVQLKGLYILRRPRLNMNDSRITLKRLPPRKAILTLLRASFNVAVADPSRLAIQLHSYAHIVSRVPVKWISYPRRFEMLPAVRDVLLEDFARA